LSHTSAKISPTVQTRFMIDTDFLEITAGQTGKGRGKRNLAIADIACAQFRVQTPDNVGAVRHFSVEWPFHTIHGALPRLYRSSSSCISFNVSMQAQKPSWA